MDQLVIATGAGSEGGLGQAVARCLTEAGDYVQFLLGPGAPFVTGATLPANGGRAMP